MAATCMLGKNHRRQSVLSFRCLPNSIENMTNVKAISTPCFFNLQISWPIWLLALPLLAFIFERSSATQKKKLNWQSNYWELYRQEHYQPIWCGQSHFSGMGQVITSRKRGLDNWETRYHRFKRKVLHHKVWRQNWTRLSQGAVVRRTILQHQQKNMKYLFRILHFSLWIGSLWLFHFSIVKSCWSSLKAIFIRRYWLRLKNWTFFMTHVTTKMKSTISRCLFCYR